MIRGVYMYCSKCGKQIADDAKFCNQCGNKVIRNDSVKPSEGIGDSRQVSNTIPVDRIKIILIVLSILGIISFTFTTMSSHYYEIIKESEGARKFESIGDTGYGIDDATDDTAQFHEMSFLTFSEQSYREFKMLNDEYYSKQFYRPRIWVNIFASLILLITFIIAVIQTYKSYRSINDSEKYLAFEKIRLAYISLVVGYIGFWLITKIPATSAKNDTISIGFDKIGYSFIYYFIIVALIILIKVAGHYEGVMIEERYKSKIGKKNSTWVCSCGHRNPNEKSRCENCSKLNPNE